MKPDLDLVFELNGSLLPPFTVGQTPHGMRRMVPIAGGTFEGPSMRGTILPGGADWQYAGSDDVWELEARYLLRTDDDVVIQVHNRGIRHAAEPVMRRMLAGESVDPGEYYFRAAPVFAAPAGRYSWLNCSIFVCTGARYASSLRLWVYRVA